jgi:RNA polymerase sigma factor (sigma-70 family)
MRMIAEVRSAARTVTSLDKPVGDDEHTSLGDLLPATGEDPLEQLDLSLRHDVLKRAVADLPDLERELIRMRYGLDGDQDPCPLTEAARRLDLSRNRARAMEQRALARLAARRELEALGSTTA